MQPIKNNIKNVKNNKKKKVKNIDNRIPPKKNVLVKGAWKKNIKHAEYGTSKLEERFAKNILDKLGVKYVYQYKMESIGRYLDYFLPEYRVAIEIDGCYWHSKGLVYEEMNPTQKHNKHVDEQKNHWCKINGIPLIRIWEDDINKHTENIIKFLKEKLNLYKKEKEINDEKKKRH